MEARSRHLCRPQCELGRDREGKVLIRPSRPLMQLWVVISVEQDTSELAVRGWASPRGIGGAQDEADHQADFSRALDAILVCMERRRFKEGTV